MESDGLLFESYAPITNNLHRQPGNGETEDHAHFPYSDANVIRRHGSIGIGGDGFALPAGMHTIRAGYRNAATWEGVTVHDSAGDTTITPHFR